MLMDNSAFPNDCRDSHEDMLDHHDLIENFPPLKPFVTKMRIWIPSKRIFLTVLVETSLVWPKSDFRWSRKSQIWVSSPNTIRISANWAELISYTGQTLHKRRLGRNSDRIACLGKSTDWIRNEEARVACWAPDRIKETRVTRWASGWVACLEWSDTWTTCGDWLGQITTNRIASLGLNSTRVRSMNWAGDWFVLA